ncbi:hypothetical protein KSP39_PZI023826 [Platanthera zijinensis]|uniref:Uncharacterized protein n=1 Tax=Platanthera zijinensis TaxID=2320716 RepID=A0AAP0AU08_9ASPA
MGNGKTGGGLRGRGQDEANRGGEEEEGLKRLTGYGGGGGRRTPHGRDRSKPREHRPVRELPPPPPSRPPLATNHQRPSTATGGHQQPPAATIGHQHLPSVIGTPQMRS